MVGKLLVTIDYVKIAQWFLLISFYQKKIREELDKACIEAGHKVVDEDKRLSEENWETARNNNIGK